MVDSWVGYCGGDSDAPTYSSVCDGDGHTEALRVEFDPSVVSYEELMRQFYADPDVEDQSRTDGTTVPKYMRQYQTAIWVQDDAQREIALRVGAEAGKKIPVMPLRRFFEAEAYHQHYCDPLARRNEGAEASGGRWAFPRPWMQ